MTRRSSQPATADAAPLATHARRAIRYILALLTITFAPVTPAAANAPNATLHVALMPDRLNTAATMRYGFTITNADGSVPPPLTRLQLYYPAHFGLITSGLGIASCELENIRELGLEGCPAESLMGHGTAIGAVPFEHETLEESAETFIFMRPFENGRISLALYVEGRTPLATQLAFPATIVPAPRPYGSAISITLPLVRVIPELPPVSITKFQATIGPEGITYYHHTHHKYLAYQPRGIQTPPRCPPHGFPFAAHFTFNDHSERTVATRVRCPR